MKKYIITVIAVLSFSAFINSGDDGKAFKKLYALEGTWKMTTKRGALCEEWKKVSNTHLQNKGFLVKGTDTIVTERVALTNTKDGVFYTSTVEDQNNRQPIAFRMTRAEGNTFVFENAEHDFPRRMVYNLVSADSLHAYIDDGINGNKRQHFYYRKQN
ncbi:MAG TPA: DUF6265 family protein [Ferruginibacter sp.]|nr:DUF6265 family protein [Ferruginibacter sp.]